MESWSHTVPTMKAFAVARDDAPAIEMIDVDAPTPRRDEAVIAVHAFSVNRGETFLLEREPAGWRPGKDISGSVVAACADGSGPAVGARVVAHVDAGGWAELVAVGCSPARVVAASRPRQAGHPNGAPDIWCWAGCVHV